MATGKRQQARYNTSLPPVWVPTLPPPAWEQAHDAAFEATLNLPLGAVLFVPRRASHHFWAACRDSGAVFCL